MVLIGATGDRQSKSKVGRINGAGYSANIFYLGYFFH
jgi:hypothetical protein